MQNWTEAIESMAVARQAVYEVDVKEIWRRGSPSAGASETEISGAEQRSEVAFDPEYRAFLRHANGWPAFWNDVDLFGIEELTGGEHAGRAQEILAAVAEFAPDEEQQEMLAALPIGVSLTSIDVFYMPVMGGRQLPQVVRTSGGEEVRYPSFSVFFQAMLQLTLEEAAVLRSDPTGGIGDW